MGDISPPKSTDNISSYNHYAVKKMVRMIADMENNEYWLKQRIERLEAALRYAVDVYGKPGGPWNVPGNPGGWLDMARKALEKGE